MAQRRLLSWVLFAIWLAPSFAAAGLSLHVALDHGEDTRAAAAAAALVHGHGHDGDAGAHPHVAVTAAAPALRTTVAETSLATPAASPIGAVASACVGGFAAARDLPPPRARGPELLSLLSLLRV